VRPAAANTCIEGEFSVTPRISTPQAYYDGLTRRQLLHVGGIGMLALGLARLLQASAPGSSAPPRRNAEKSCIFILQLGGPSHVDTWDLKPDAPPEIRGPYKSIATSVPGVQVCELLPQLARLADRYCLVRSMTHRSIGHDPAVDHCLSGQTNVQINAPYYGAVMSKLRPVARSLPPYVWLPQWRFGLGGDRHLGGGFLGPAHGPLVIGTPLDNPSTPHFRARALDPAQGISPERIQERHRLLNTLEPAGRPVLRTAPGAALRVFQERAVDLISGPEARRAFALDQEPRTVRDRYGWHPFGQNLLLARRLVEGGVRLISVVAYVGKPPGDPARESPDWDMHGGRDRSSIFGTDSHSGLGWVLPRFDEALAALLIDLKERGLLESTLVVAVGEFGRSPTISANPPGRDHWPYCYSALLAGCGVRGGQAWGASDRKGAAVKDNPVSPQDFGATVFHALGVPPETPLAADGFSKRVSEGRPILELFG
jgi:hypothetical protein